MQNLKQNMLKNAIIFEKIVKIIMLKDPRPRTIGLQRLGALPLTSRNVTQPTATSIVIALSNLPAIKSQL